MLEYRDRTTDRPSTTLALPTPVRRTVEAIVTDIRFIQPRSSDAYLSLALHSSETDRESVETLHLHASRTVGRQPTEMAIALFDMFAMDPLIELISATVAIGDLADPVVLPRRGRPSISYCASIYSLSEVHVDGVRLFEGLEPDGLPVRSADSFGAYSTDEFDASRVMPLSVASRLLGD